MHIAGQMSYEIVTGCHVNLPDVAKQIIDKDTKDDLVSVSRRHKVNGLFRDIEI